MRVHRAPAETRHVLHVSAQRGSWLLYNSAMGAPLFYPRTLLWSSPPAFLLICRTITHRCLRVLQRVGVGVGAGVLSWSEERRLSQACVPTDCHTSSCGSCDCRSAKDARHPGACRLAAGGDWACPGGSLLPLPDLKWEEQGFTRTRRSNATTDPWGRCGASQLPTRWPWTRQNTLSSHPSLSPFSRH